MNLNTILLLICASLLILGAGQRVLDRMRLNDRQALILIFAMLLGGLLPDIPLFGGVTLNVGGALIPLGICVYLLIRCRNAKEIRRALITSILTAAAVYALGALMPAEPEDMILDSNYVYGLSAGGIAYLFGRSRRCAFIAGILGMTLSDIFSHVLLRIQGISQTLDIGGAGAADAIVISGLVAVLLAELAGEITERLLRGTSRRQERRFNAGRITGGNSR